MSGLVLFFPSRIFSEIVAKRRSDHSLGSGNQDYSYSEAFHPFMAVSASLSPYHLIDNAGIALNYLYDLMRLHSLRHNPAREFRRSPSLFSSDCCIDCLKQTFFVDPRKNEAGFIQRLWGARWMCVCRLPGRDARQLVKKLLSSGSVPESDTYRKSMHLQAVIIMKAERLMSDNTLIELKARGFETLFAARMTGIKYRHIVLFSHLINSTEQRPEIRVGVDILLSVCGKKYIFSLFKFEICL